MLSSRQSRFWSETEVMILKYDPEADAAYVSVGGPMPDGGVARTEDVSLGGQYERGIDYGADGQILGYEFLNVSRGVDLSGLPHRAELGALFVCLKGIRVLEAT
jgi:uncharacterized protein YuzE